MPIKFCLAGLIVLYSCSFSSPHKHVIVFIGDSITWGAGLNPDSAPPAVAYRYLQASMHQDLSYSNQGHNGFTTQDFLPGLQGAFAEAVSATTHLVSDSTKSLLFSIMLGTNDSADFGTNGAGASPDKYKANMKAIVDSLLHLFPHCKIILQYPIYYSPNTYNGARYMATGLQRLQSYFPQIDKLANSYQSDYPGQVCAGDSSVFHYFQEHYQDLCRPESGKAGTFYLHPNAKGAEVLGAFWAKSIAQALEIKGGS
jgi:lysophospholipase L1-like esterase